MLARHELSVYSPVSARSIVRAGVLRASGAARVIELARELIRARYGAQHVLLVDSGRSALQLAIELLLPRGKADRVVALPAFQCYEVASAAVGAGCRIALYDVDPDTLGPRLDSLERALAQGARCVVVAPLYGLPVDWEVLEQLATRHGATLVEDAAQSHGAQFRGRPVGSFGTLSVLSFGRGKGWTGGRGGALLLRSADVAARARETALAPPAWTAESRAIATTVVQMLFGRPQLYGIPASIPSLGLGETIYHAPTTPAHVLPYAAALLVETSEPSAREVSTRRDNAAFWAAHLPAELSSRAPAVCDGGVAGYLRFPLQVPPAAFRLASGDQARRAGIARSYPLTLGELAAVKPLMVDPGTDCPGAYTLSRQLVTLPTHSLLTRSTRDAILTRCREWVRTPPRRTPDTPV